MTSNARKLVVFAALPSGIVGAALGLVASRAFASGIPATGALTYSGYLEDATGAAVTGSKNIAVELWSAATAGTKACERVSSATQVTAGRFSVPLPDSCTAAVKANPDLWVQVQIDGTAIPRTKLGAVPYAVEADHAVTALAAGGALDTRIAAVEAFSKSLVRPGTIVPFAGSACPAGTVAGDGSSLARAGTYAALFTAIGSTYGASDGAHFNLPDYRGLFLRGAGSNGAMKTATGNAVNAPAVGSSQDDQEQGHNHAVVGDTSGSGTYATVPFTVVGVSPTIDPSTGLFATAMMNDGANGPPRAGNETRPANRSVTFCVAY